jgi:hypothetical protein
MEGKAMIDVRGGLVLAATAGVMILAGCGGRGGDATAIDGPNQVLVKVAGMT